MNPPTFAYNRTVKSQVPRRGRLGDLEVRGVDQLRRPGASEDATARPADLVHATPAALA
jgi:hypothetical protein